MAGKSWATRALVVTILASSGAVAQENPGPGDGQGDVQVIPDNPFPGPDGGPGDVQVIPDNPFPGPDDDPDADDDEDDGPNSPPGGDVPAAGVPKGLLDLHAQVMATATQLQLDRRTTQRLVRPVTQAARQTAAGKTGKAVRALDRFSRRVIQISARSDALTAAAPALLGQAASASDALIRSRRLLPGLALPCAQQPAPCAPRAMLVAPEASAPRGPRDGSLFRPFRGPQEALDAAARDGACGVTLYLLPGVYRGPALSISRDTRLQGVVAGQAELQMPVVSRGGHRLEVVGLDFRVTGGEAAVDVASPCARTTLQRVDIRTAMRHGVRQVGGRLEAAGVRVQGTRGTGDAARPGAGVLLAGGAVARLERTRIDGGSVSGFALVGEGTEALAVELEVEGNRLDSAQVQVFAAAACARPEAPLAGIDVMTGARLYLAGSRVSGNELVGLLVRDGAMAHVRHSTVRASYVSRRAALERIDCDGGFNVLVESAGAATLAGVLVENALVGLVNREGGVYDGDCGILAHLELGIAGYAPPDGLEALGRSWFVDVRRNIGFAELPLPDLGDPFDPSPPPPLPMGEAALLDVVVPFDCEGCATVGAHAGLGPAYLDHEYGLCDLRVSPDDLADISNRFGTTIGNTLADARRLEDLHLQSSEYIAADDDWYRLDMPAAGSARVWILFRDAKANLDLEIYDAAGGLVGASASRADGESIVFAASGPLTAYFRVFPRGGGRAPYRIFYERD